MKTHDILQNGGVGVLATDTLYGVVGQALNREAVERVYKVKGRSPEKPCIILISDPKQLELFGVKNNEYLRSVWPGPVSAVLSCGRDDLEYLHRGTKTLAFRLPAKESLRDLIAETGPLIAPSANPEGESPAVTIDDARDYFGDTVDFYEAGEVGSQASTLVSLVTGKPEVLRP